jgi:hypothetical protein
VPLTRKASAFNLNNNPTLGFKPTIFKKATQNKAEV